MYLCICIVAYYKHTYTRHVCINVKKKWYIHTFTVMLCGTRGTPQSKIGCTKIPGLKNVLCLYLVYCPKKRGGCYFWMTLYYTLLPRPRRGLRGIVFSRSVCLSVCLCVCLCVCMCVCMCVCVCVSGRYFGILFLGY